MPTDEHEDHQHQRQLAGTRGLATVGLDELLDALAGIELFQDRPREAVTEFVGAWQLRYSKGHEESPFDISMLVFSLVCQIASSSSTYLSGIAPKGGLYIYSCPTCATCRTRPPQGGSLHVLSLPGCNI